MTQSDVQYVPRTVVWHEGQPLPIKGRVVGILPLGTARRRVTVLVEEPAEGGDADTPETDSEGVTDDDTHYCTETKSDGSRCTRDVDESGDTCWQH